VRHVPHAAARTFTVLMSRAVARPGCASIGAWVGEFLHRQNRTLVRCWQLPRLAARLACRRRLHCTALAVSKIAVLCVVGPTIWLCGCTDVTYRRSSIYLCTCIGAIRLIVHEVYVGKPICRERKTLFHGC
jgi:hypothetical protein